MWQRPSKPCSPEGLVERDYLFSSRTAAILRLGARARKTCTQQLFGTGRYLVSTAGVPAARTLATAFGQLSAATSEVERLMEASSKRAAYVFTSLREFIPSRVATSNLPVKDPKLTWRKIPVEVKLSCGMEQTIYTDASTSIAQLQEELQASTSVKAQQQVMVISEERTRRPGISKLVQRVQTHLTLTRLDARSAIISWVNFFFLPEVFNRELCGRGVISWAKGTTWYQSLQSQASMAAPADCCSKGMIRVQIEQLSGAVLVLEVETTLTLGELKQAIQRRVGIVGEQQRILIIERHGPGRLTNLGNKLLVHSFFGVKLAMGAAVWVGTSIFCTQRTGFPVVVRTNAGHDVTLNITGNTTVNQIRAMVHRSLSAAAGDDVQEIRFPDQLPPLRTENPAESHIIRASSCCV